MDMLGKAIIPVLALAFMVLIEWTIYALYIVYVKKVFKLSYSTRIDNTKSWSI